jgi:ubiquinol oxidase
VHFAEEWNELHHLQIMESLGGEILVAADLCSAHAVERM